MITWRPQTHISHLPTMHLDREAFDKLPAIRSPLQNVWGLDIWKELRDGVWVIVARSRFGLHEHRPVIVVRADMKVAP